MGKKHDPWIQNDLEAMACDLQVILDSLGDLDNMTVGECRRIQVLAESVRDGARAVVMRTCLQNPFEPIKASRVAGNPSSLGTPAYPSNWADRAV